jgi:hypothetical protein
MDSKVGDSHEQESADMERGTSETAMRTATEPYGDIDE